MSRTTQSVLIGLGLGVVVVGVIAVFVIGPLLYPARPRLVPVAEATPLPTGRPPEGTSTLPASPPTSRPTAPLPATLTPALRPLNELPNPPVGKIVFTCFDGDDEICLLNLADMTIAQLTNNSVGDWYASLTPDGAGVLFARQISGSNYEIMRMRTDGSEAVQLTRNGAQNYAPELSPDGAQIVYTSSAGGAQQVWLMEAGGGNPRALTSGAESIDPTWSPDGSRVAFASNRSGQRQLWTMAADGSDLRQVTDLPEMGGRNAFSADGATLAFYRGPFNGRNIFVIGADGGNLRQLTDGGDNLGPDFSPDGHWITFGSFRDGNNEIYLMRPDGSEVYRLTNHRRSEYQPRWGP
jgi:Tol biopolymer transport system component